MQEKETYSTLLRQILEDQNYTLRDLHEELLNLDYEITYASLYSYLTGKTVPSFDIAKSILEKERYEIEEDELRETLVFSKKKWKENQQEDSNLLNMHVKIKPGTIAPSFQNNAETLKSTIEMRAEELFSDSDMITQFTAGGKRKISAYIAYLIKKDLMENDFIQED